MSPSTLSTKLLAVMSLELVCSQIKKDLEIGLSIFSDVSLHNTVTVIPRVEDTGKGQKSTSWSTYTNHSRGCSA